MQNELNAVTRTAGELCENLKRVEEAGARPVARPVHRGFQESGNWVNLEDPEDSQQLRKFLHTHYERLGFKLRGEIQEEVRRQIGEAKPHAPSTQGGYDPTTGPGEAREAPAPAESQKVSLERFATKIRQLADLGIHEPSIESATKELKRIIKASDGRFDAIVARFGKYMVEEMLPSGEREDYYSRFSTWFRNFSENRACLIVPGKGESLDTQRCVSVGRQATSAGPMEAIIRTERPGVMVGDKVIARARVLTT